MTHDLRTHRTDDAPQPIVPPNPDAPVRIDVAMPRGLYDRLTDHDEAPRSRYDMATGRAEFVAAPGVSHEWRAWKLSALFTRIEQMLEAADRPPEFLVAGASRLLSDDGAFEPDTCVFFDPAQARAAMRVDGYLDTRKGAPVPDLVVEIDRSVDSSDKLTYRTSAWECAKRGPGAAPTACVSGSPEPRRTVPSRRPSGATCCPDSTARLWTACWRAGRRGTPPGAHAT